MASLVHPCHQPHMLLLSVRDASLSMLKSSCCRKRSRSWNDPAVVRTDDGEIWRNMFPKLFDTSRKEIERTLQSIITVHMFLRYFFLVISTYHDVSHMYIYIYISLIFIDLPKGPWPEGFRWVLAHHEGDGIRRCLHWSLGGRRMRLLLSLLKM